MKEKVRSGRRETDHSSVSGHAPDDSANGDGPAYDDARVSSSPASAHARRATSLQQVLEGRGWTFVRVCSDALALTLTVALVAWTALILDPEAPGAQLLWAYPVLTVILLALRGLYRADHHLPLLDAVAHIAGAAALTAMLLIAVIGVTDSDARPAYLVGPVWLGGTLALVAGHVSLEWARGQARKRRIGGRATVIVGAGRVGAKPD